MELFKAGRKPSLEKMRKNGQFKRIREGKSRSVAQKITMGRAASYRILSVFNNKEDCKFAVILNTKTNSDKILLQHFLICYCIL